jgi:hypothetical protein
MKKLSKGNALIAVLLWFVAVLLLVPYNEWVHLKSSYNGGKFVCIAVGLLVLTKTYQAFRKPATS